MRDTLIISLTDAVTCILAGVCVFGTLGNLAYEQNKTVDEVVSSGTISLQDYLHIYLLSIWNHI